MPPPPDFDYAAMLDFEDDDAIPRRIVNLRAFYGDLVRFASIGCSGEAWQTPVQCRRRPGRCPCGGLLFVRRQDLPSAIIWRCPDCGADGQITGWEDGDSDLRDTDCAIDADAISIPVSPAEHSALRDFARDDERGVPLVFRAVVADGPLLLLSADQARELADTLTTSALPAARGQRRRRLAEVVDRLTAASAHAGVTPPLETADRSGSSSAGGSRHGSSPAGEVAGRRSRRSPHGTSDPRTFQLKVSLRGVNPPIWRRLLVPADLPLPALHSVLQRAMGWQDCHLHLFLAGERRYAPPDHFGESTGQDSTEVRLCDLAPRTGALLGYDYDFGDGWEHDLLVEGVLDEPCQEIRCLSGRRSCPPEDCGGPWGYGELCAALADPTHESHAEMRNWVAGDFDPDAFDVQRIDSVLRAFRL